MKFDKANYCLMCLILFYKLRKQLGNIKRVCGVGLGEVDRVDIKKELCNRMSVACSTKTLKSCNKKALFHWIYFFL